MNFRTLLADAPDVEKHPLRFPFYASPKLDGIRCTITPAGPLTRSLKAIPNRELAAQLAALPIGLDGELIAGDPFGAGVMQRTSSRVMSHEGGTAGITFNVFDMLDCFYTPAAPFRVRMMEARRTCERYSGFCDWVRPVEQVRVDSFAELMKYEADAIKRGYEGAMIRSPGGVYKFGRATAKEQTLLKLKRFEDAEGRVLDAFELEHNANEQTRDERGLAKRSSAKAGKVGADTLGGFVVELGPPWTAKTLRVGNGWTAAERAELWRRWKAAPGQFTNGPNLLKYKFQLEGAKDAPRLPVAIGWRHPHDI